MSSILKPGVDDKLLDYWDRIRGDIGKFDNIIVSNYIQHMTILVGLMTLSAYLYLGNPELAIFCCVINFLVTILSISFKGQNSLYQTLIGNNIEFAIKIEDILFNEGYRLTIALDKNLPVKSQDAKYKVSYYIMFFVSIILGAWFLILRFNQNLL
ncbi:MAG: hypothetical protein ACTSQJ_05120 [Promethearchaeota archaeon]